MFFSRSPLNLNKKTESNTVFDHKNQGIPEKDLRALQEFAAARNLILLFRPVEPLAKSLHEEGGHPTKGYPVKAKSASFGLGATHIPTDSSLSKLFNATEAAIKKANKEIAACVQQGHAVIVPLKISEKRFQELRKKHIIYPLKKEEAGFLPVYCPYPHEGEHPEKFALFYTKKIKTESVIEYEVYTAEKKPFEVLADTVLKRPLIADYDLLAIFSPWRNFNQDNIRPNPEVTLAERHRKLSPREQRRSMESEERFYDREVLNLGNITPSTIGIISELNRALGKEGPLACIHHNDDAGSPASNPAANYPITVLLPSINIFNSTLLLIETTEEFVDFINKINEIGDYRVEVNPLWELPVKWAAIRKYFFCKAKLAYYRDTSSENMERTLIGMFKSINLSDATFVKELTHLFKLMVEGNCNDSLFEKFFDIIQYSLSTNSILVIKLNHSLETLYNNEALSEKNIDRLLILNNILREDRLGFYKILDNLNILSPVDAKIIDGYLKLAEAHIYNGKLNSMGFKKALKEFTLEVNVTNITIFQP